jgi:hypothetical protein
MQSKPTLAEGVQADTRNSQTSQRTQPPSIQTHSKMHHTYLTPKGPPDSTGPRSMQSTLQPTRIPTQASGASSFKQTTASKLPAASKADSSGHAQNRGHRMDQEECSDKQAEGQRTTYKPQAQQSHRAQGIVQARSRSPQTSRSCRHKHIQGTSHAHWAVISRGRGTGKAVYRPEQPPAGQGSRPLDSGPQPTAEPANVTTATGRGTSAQISQPQPEIPLIAPLYFSHTPPPLPSINLLTTLLTDVESKHIRPYQQHTRTKDRHGKAASTHATWHTPSYPPAQAASTYATWHTPSTPRHRLTVHTPPGSNT